MQRAHQFQGQTVKGQGWRWSGHTVSAEPGVHTACFVKAVNDINGLIMENVVSFELLLSCLTI